MCVEFPGLLEQLYEQKYPDLESTYLYREHFDAWSALRMCCKELITIGLWVVSMIKDIQQA